MRAKVVQVIRKFVAANYPSDFKHKNRKAREMWNQTPRNKRHALKVELQNSST